MKEKIKNQKGFSVILIVIIVVATVSILSIGGYFGIKQFKIYQDKQAEKEKQTQELVRSQQEALTETQQKIEELKQQLETSEEISRQERELEQARLKAELEQKIKKLEEQPQSPTVDLVSIIEEWQVRIVYVECEFRYPDTFRLYDERAGSGIVLMSGLQLLLEEFEGEVIVMTNKHIVTDENGYGPDSCNVTIGKDSYHIKNLDVRIQPGIDLGYMKISNPTENTKSIANSPFTICKTIASVGEDIVILGYPSIGSITNITATEGIISGYESYYYITSAKIERGNSGGASILLKDGCYLGIPTYVVIGQMESLGRILNVSRVFIWP